MDERKKTIPTIRSTAEFARYVGLARTTVSRVLNGQPGLKKKTIERVQKAIEETGFTSNPYALYLKGGRTATIGICLETLLNPTAMLKLNLLQRQLRDNNYSSLIEVLEPGNGRPLIRHFISMRVEAVVFIGQFPVSDLGDHIEELKTFGIPHLLIDQHGTPGADSVALDRSKAMSAVIEHLLGLGHRSFGLLAMSSDLQSIVDRREGVRKALKKHGLDPDTAAISLDHLHVRDKDFEYGKKLAGSFLELKKKMPTALVGMNDEIAIGAMWRLQEAGLRVPEDVSVTGFNNLHITEHTTPPVTTVDQRIENTIKAATRVILDRVEDPEASANRRIRKKITPKLIIRGSTGPAKS